MRTLREQKTCLMHVYPVRPMAGTPLEILKATNGLAVFPENETRATNLKLRTAHHFYLHPFFHVSSWNSRETTPPSILIGVNANRTRLFVYRQLSPSILAWVTIDRDRRAKLTPDRDRVNVFDEQGKEEGRTIRSSTRLTYYRFESLTRNACGGRPPRKPKRVTREEDKSFTIAYENRRLYLPFDCRFLSRVNKKQNFLILENRKKIRKGTNPLQTCMCTYSERLAFTFSLRNDFDFSARWCSIFEASGRRETGVNWTDKRYRLSDRADRLAADPHRARIRSGVVGTRLIRLAVAPCGPSRSPNGTPCRRWGLSPIRNPDHDLVALLHGGGNTYVKRVLARRRHFPTNARWVESLKVVANLRVFSSRSLSDTRCRFFFFFFCAREKYPCDFLSHQFFHSILYFREITRSKIQSRTRKIENFTVWKIYIPRSRYLKSESR